VRESSLDLSATDAWNESFSWSNASTLQLCDSAKFTVTKFLRVSRGASRRHQSSRFCKLASLARTLAFCSRWNTGERSCKRTLRDSSFNRVSNLHRCRHRNYHSMFPPWEIFPLSRTRFEMIFESQPRSTGSDLPFGARIFPGESCRGRGNVCLPNRADKRSHDRGRSREIEGRCLRYVDEERCGPVALLLGNVWYHVISIAICARLLVRNIKSFTEKGLVYSNERVTGWKCIIESRAKNSDIPRPNQKRNLLKRSRGLRLWTRA